MSKPLARGVWCTSCEFFESDDERGNQTCRACGCDNEYHVEVKVVEDKDNEAPIEWELDLPIRAYNALYRNGIRTMGDLREALERTDLHLMDLRGLGFKSYEKIKDEMRRWEEASG